MSQHQVAPDVEAVRLMREGRLQEALSFAQRAVAGQTTCLPAHGLLATLWLQLGKRREAENAVIHALECSPGGADAYDALAHVSMLLGDHTRSHALYTRVVALAPHVPQFWYNLASSERSFGNLAAAEAACNRAIELDAKQYPSYLLRAELRTQTASHNHIANLRAHLARPGVEDRARIFLGYALAKELDDLERFDEAYGCFFDAATTRKRYLAYDVAVDEDKMRRIEAVFPSRPAITQPRTIDVTPVIFIVGLPRSGTTLLERILTGLPGVVSRGETDDFARALMSTSKPATNSVCNLTTGAPTGADDDVFSRAAAADPQAVAAAYLQHIGDPPRDTTLIEKMPLNYLYLAAIHRALPGAKILNITRDSIDSCFAMYRTLFGNAYPFTYDFDDLARYYAAYERLMRHWRNALGENLFDVSYDELVNDPEHVGQSVAQHCGLTWTPAALEIEKNASVSLTASAAQIRRPIYKSSSGRWRNYRTHLNPLIEALHRCGVSTPTDT